MYPTTKAFSVLLDILTLIHICVSLAFILQKSRDPLFPDEDQHKHNSLLYTKMTEKMFNIAVKVQSFFCFQDVKS